MLDQAHMNSLFENATEGIILTGAAGRIITVNPAAERMFGYKKDELNDQLLEILIRINLNIITMSCGKGSAGIHPTG